MRPSGEEKQNSSSNNSNGVRGSALLVNEPFEEAFGSKSQIMTARVSKMDSTDNDDSDPKDGSNNNHKSNNDLMQQLPFIGGKAEIIWTTMIHLWRRWLTARKQEEEEYAKSLSGIEKTLPRLENAAVNPKAKAFFQRKPHELQGYDQG